MNPSDDLSAFCLRREARSRSVSAENPTGAPGQGGRATVETSLNPAMALCARDLGVGWKMSPCLRIPAGGIVTVMDQAGPGILRHWWLTSGAAWYPALIVRVYWDGEATPAVECPLGDFFCCPWGAEAQVLALPINVNPQGGMNCFFPMPFRSHCRITVENRSAQECTHFFYTIDYTLEAVPAAALYFHACHRQSLPVADGIHTVVDIAGSDGHLAGASMGWRQRRPGWWGEGEVKIFLDDDTDYPTICGTGTEDYFGGAWNFGKKDFSAPYFGFRQLQGVSEEAGARMSLYRFHLPDPVHFQSRLRLTVQSLGWRTGADWRYEKRDDEVTSVAYWYQASAGATDRGR